MTARFPIKHLLAGGGVISQAYNRHVYRYYAWDQREYRFFVRMMGGTALIVLVPLMLFLLRYSYRHHEEKLHLAKARTYFSQGDMAKASLNAKQALSFNPLDVSACRILAQIAATAHSSEELTWQQRIVNIQPTMDNKLALADAALRLQGPPFLRTAQILDELAPAGVNNAAYQALAAELAMNTGHPEQAVSHFEAAAHLNPANGTYGFNLAILHLNSSNASEKNSARVMLEKMAQEKDCAPGVLRALVSERLAAGEVSGAEIYSRQLLASSQGTLSDRLQNLEVLKRMNNSSFPDRLNSLEMEAATNAASVAKVSDWLQANNLMAKDLAWLANLPDGIRAKQSVQLTLARAFMQSGNWQALLDLIARGNWEDQDFLRLAMVSHAWSEMGVPTVAASNWGEAVRKASDHFEAMTNLLGLAQQWQLTQEQHDLQARLEQFPK